MKMTFPEFQRRLKKWRENMPREIRHMLLRAGKQEIVPHIQKNYLTGPRPQKLGVKTGRLRRSIHPRLIDERNTIRLEIGTNVPYGRIHEYGVGKMPERPFLRPAIRDKRSRVMQMIADGMMEAYKHG